MNDKPNLVKTNNLITDVIALMFISVFKFIVEERLAGRSKRNTPGAGVELIDNTDHLTTFVNMLGYV